MAPSTAERVPTQASERAKQELADILNTKSPTQRALAELFRDNSENWEMGPSGVIVGEFLRTDEDPRETDLYLVLSVKPFGLKLSLHASDHTVKGIKRGQTNLDNEANWMISFFADHGARDLVAELHRPLSGQPKLSLLGEGETLINLISKLHETYKKVYELYIEGKDFLAR